MKIESNRKWQRLCGKMWICIPPRFCTLTFVAAGTNGDTNFHTAVNIIGARAMKTCLVRSGKLMSKILASLMNCFAALNAFCKIIFTSCRKFRNHGIHFTYFVRTSANNVCKRVYMNSKKESRHAKRPHG